MQHWDHIERVLGARSLDELAHITGTYANALGFEFHAYASMAPQITSGSQSYFNFMDLPQGMDEHYTTLANPEAAQRDCRILHIRAGLPATAWSANGKVGYTKPAIARRAVKLLHSVHDHGLRAGITAPVWAPGTHWAFMQFSTGTRSNLRDMNPAVAPAYFFASCLHAAIQRLRFTAGERRLLSGRELEVLRWSCIGKTAWEISVILGISERTAHFHLQRAARKLQVRGSRAAAARALALGLISL